MMIQHCYVWDWLFSTSSLPSCETLLVETPEQSISSSSKFHVHNISSIILPTINNFLDFTYICTCTLPSISRKSYPRSTRWSQQSKSFRKPWKRPEPLEVSSYARPPPPKALRPLLATVLVATPAYTDPVCPADAKGPPGGEMRVAQPSKNDASISNTFTTPDRTANAQSAGDKHQATGGNPHVGTSFFKPGTGSAT